MYTKKLGSGLGPPRPRRPLAFVQPCPMGVTPLANEGRTSDSVRGDAGSACQAVARISRCSRHGAHWHALSLNSCAYSLLILYKLFTKMARQFRRDKSWHFGKFFEHFKILVTTWYALFHVTRIATHAQSHSFLTGTPNCVPWRTPFVGLLPMWILP